MLGAGSRLLMYTGAKSDRWFTLLLSPDDGGEFQMSIAEGLGLEPKWYGVCRSLGGSEPHERAVTLAIVASIRNFFIDCPTYMNLQHVSHVGFLSMFSLVSKMDESLYCSDLRKSSRINTLVCFHLCCIPRRKRFTFSSHSMHLHSQLFDFPIS
jgi:hypothetical protein